MDLLATGDLRCAFLAVAGIFCPGLVPEDFNDFFWMDMSAASLRTTGFRYAADGSTELAKAQEGR
jgi:hypothetical protein